MLHVNVVDVYIVGKFTVHDILKSEEKLKAFQKGMKDDVTIESRRDRYNNIVKRANSTS